MPLLLLPLAACGQGTDAADTPSADGETTTTVATSAPAASSSTARKVTTTETATPPTVTETVAANVAAADAAAPQSVYTTDPVQIPQSNDANLVIQDVRAGSHDGFDRVVFEYAGQGTPGINAGYTAEPRQQASGYPMDVPGGAYLELSIHGTPMATEPLRKDLLVAGPTGVAAGNVAGVVHGGVFEADTQYVIGLDTTRPYSVQVLENPTRVVVDFQR